MNVIFTKEELSKIFQRNVEYGICDICVNSKIAKHGDIFIALHGENVNGHDFIADALNNGATLAISEKNIHSVSKNKLIVCESTYGALLRLAEYNTVHSNAKYVCVTGSVGKTTTKNMIYHIVNASSSNEIYASRKNFNSKIGLPICAATMPRNSDIGVFEMGMSNTGDIKHLIDIIHPNVAVITNINPVHLAFFPSEFDIAKAKSEILEKSPEYLIIPGNSPYTDFLKAKAKLFNVKNIITFGENEKSDVSIVSCDFRENVTDIHAKIFEKSVHYQINSMNDAFAINSLAAIAAAYAATRIDVQHLADCMTSFVTESNRGGIEYLKNKSIILINDSYNASPASMKSALRLLSHFKNKRKIAILGDMKELGGDEIHFHENLSPTIDKCEVDLVFACGELSKHMYDNLLKNKQGEWRRTSDDLMDSLIGCIKEGDCVLIKGSRSMKMENISDAIHDFCNRR